jgi:hypothetical protein
VNQEPSSLGRLPGIEGAAWSQWQSVKGSGLTPLYGR